MTLKQKGKKTDNFDALCREVAKYIQFHGGKAVVIGGIRVSYRGPLRHHFKFEVDFTGKAPK